MKKSSQSRHVFRALRGPQRLGGRGFQALRPGLPQGASPTAAQQARGRAPGTRPEGPRGTVVVPRQEPHAGQPRRGPVARSRNATPGEASTGVPKRRDRPQSRAAVPGRSPGPGNADANFATRSMDKRNVPYAAACSGADACLGPVASSAKSAPEKGRGWKGKPSRASSGPKGGPQGRARWAVGPYGHRGQRKGRPSPQNEAWS